MPRVGFLGGTIPGRGVLGADDDYSVGSLNWMLGRKPPPPPSKQTYPDQRTLPQDERVFSDSFHPGFAAQGEERPYRAGWTWVNTGLAGYDKWAQVPNAAAAVGWGGEGRDNSYRVDKPWYVAVSDAIDGFNKDGLPGLLPQWLKWALIGGGVLLVVNATK